MAPQVIVGASAAQASCGGPLAALCVPAGSPHWEPVPGAHLGCLPRGPASQMLESAEFVALCECKIEFKRSLANVFLA